MPDTGDLRGRLVVVSGPSGVGKSTLLARLGERLPFRFSVSVTTRAPRPNEVEGIDYHFVDRDAFDRMITDRHLVEWAEYGGNLYGTPIDGVADALAAGGLIVLDIELEGARQVRSLFPDATLIWIDPPSFPELERRLRQRGDTSTRAMDRRLHRAKRDMQLAPALFDHIVVNDDLERAVEEIIGLLARDDDH